MPQVIQRYNPQPPKPRLRFWNRWLYSADAYTIKERSFRESILRVRKNSGIDSYLLDTSVLWFNEDPSQAYQILNKEAWFLAKEYVPHTRISYEDFGASQSNRQSTWGLISDLRFHISDFLLQRSRRHRESELNEPFNFIYLDLRRMFTLLGEHSDPKYVASQIPLINLYLQRLNSITPTHHSSDKLFIEFCQQQFQETLNTNIAQELHSQQFGKTIETLQQEINTLGEQYHSLLHFALVDIPVNPHPYWSYFKQEGFDYESNDFPFLTAKRCFQTKLDFIDPQTPQAWLLPSIEHCPTLQFSSFCSAYDQQIYLKNTAYLQELIHFKNFLINIESLARQGGEWFTKQYFQQDLLNLFHNIELFFINIQSSMNELLGINNKIRFKTTEALDSMSVIDQYIQYAKRVRYNAFLQNQAHLARFNINRNRLEEQLKTVTQLLYNIKNQLNPRALPPGGMTTDATPLEQNAQMLLISIDKWQTHLSEHFDLPIPVNHKRWFRLEAPSKEKVQSTKTPLERVGFSAINDRPEEAPPMITHDHEFFSQAAPLDANACLNQHREFDPDARAVASPGFFKQNPNFIIGAITLGLACNSGAVLLLAIWKLRGWLKTRVPLAGNTEKHSLLLAAHELSRQTSSSRTLQRSPV